MTKKTIGSILITLMLSLGVSLGQNIDTAIINDETISNFDVNNAVTNIKDLKTSVDNITQQLFALDAKEKGDKGMTEKYRETRKEIVSIISTITQTTDNASKTLRQVAVYQKEILDATKELKNSRLGSTETKQYIADLSNFIYKLDTKLYNENGSGIDDLKLLLNSDNIPRTLANDYALQSMVEQLNQLINSFDENETQSIEALKKYNQIKNKAQQKLLDYQLEIEKLQQKKNYLVQFLALYQKDKIQRETSLNTLFESTKGVYDKITELNKDIRRGVYKVDFNIDKALADLEAMDTNNEQQHPLAWPVYPIYDIQTYFGDENYQKQYGVPHIGIQIKADQQTPVYASRDGIAYFVADNDDIGINRTMIMHTDGYTTVYEYLNKTLIKKGDIVRRGQLIGYSGGEPGTRGAGFISKGPNLTFMTFKNGIALDPFDILDASIVQDKSVLPEGYQIKYLRDKYARPIDITKLNIMTGATLLERETEFLRLYGVGIYKSPVFRETAVDGTNIDKDVVICIAFAESTLGRYLSTANNIGNVGNNDRGDRIGFGNALVGARVIPLTLNNKHLGDYHTINQLSRYGNKDGKIYASSPINWQTNVLKCLSQIKGYYIPEDFPFRTGPNPNLTDEHQQLINLLKTNTVIKK